MRDHPKVNAGNCPGTAIAVLLVGLTAIGILFSVLGSTLYLNGGSAHQSALSTIPARAVSSADIDPAK
jgi:hypothetical protein